MKRQWGVNRLTGAMAVEEMRKAGLVVTKPGVGTFVAAAPGRNWSACTRATRSSPGCRPRKSAELLGTGVPHARAGHHQGRRPGRALQRGRHRPTSQRATPDGRGPKRPREAKRGGGGIQKARLRVSAGGPRRCEVAVRHVFRRAGVACPRPGTGGYRGTERARPGGQGPGYSTETREQAPRRGDGTWVMRRAPGGTHAGSRAAGRLGRSRGQRLAGGGYRSLNGWRARAKRPPFGGLLQFPPRSRPGAGRGLPRARVRASATTARTRRRPWPRPRLAVQLVHVPLAAQQGGDRRDQAGGDREVERDVQAGLERAADQAGEERVAGQVGRVAGAGSLVSAEPSSIWIGL